MTQAAQAPFAFPQHQKRLQRLLQALDLQRWLGLHIKAPLHLAVGVHADAQRAGRRGLLQPSRDVDGQAAQAVVVLHPAAAHHAAGVDADAGVEALEAIPAFDVITMPRRLSQQGQAAVHRALGVVFSGAGGVMRAEGHLEVVAGIAQHLAAMLLDDGGESGQRTVDHRLHLFRVEPLNELRAADDV